MRSQPQEIVPGTHVRNQHGIIGVVQRIDNQTTGDSSPHAIVESMDGRLHFALPLNLMSAMGELNDVRYAEVAIPDTDLAKYSLDAQTGEADMLNGAPIASATPNSPVATNVVSASGAIDASTRPLPQPAAQGRGVEVNRLDQGELDIPLVAEQLGATTQPMQLGTLHIHKSVQSAPQRIAVPLAEEHAEIQRIPAESFDPRLRDDPNLIVIPLVQERLVVQVQPVVTEYICIRKDRVTTTHEAQATVRREVLTVTQEAAPDAPPLFDVQEQPPQAQG